MKKRYLILIFIIVTFPFHTTYGLGLHIKANVGQFSAVLGAIFYTSVSVSLGALMWYFIYKYKLYEKNTYIQIAFFVVSSLFYLPLWTYIVDTLNNIFVFRSGGLINPLEYFGNWPVIIGKILNGYQAYVVVLMASYLYIFLMKRVEISYELANTALSLSKTKLSNLNNQINLHFLFNSLNTILSLIKSDKKSAEKAVEDLGAMVQKIASQDRSEITLQEELELVGTYLSLEKLQMGERLSLAIDVDEKAKTALVPPLSLQTLAENGIRHGISQMKEGGILTIQASVSSESLQITVTDNGRGVHSSADTQNTGVGLENLDARLKALYEDDAHLSLENLSEGGCRASFTIPLRHKIGELGP